MSVLIGYIRSTSSTSSQPPPAGCKAARKVCVSFFTFLPTQSQSQVPSPKSTTPQQNPSCSTQESRPVSDEEYSYLGPQLCYRTPSLLCPLPLASAPRWLCCTVLHSKF